MVSSECVDNEAMLTPTPMNYTEAGVLQIHIVYRCIYVYVYVKIYCKVSSSSSSSSSFPQPIAVPAPRLDFSKPNNPYNKACLTGSQ